MKFWIEGKILDKATGIIYYKTIGIEAGPDEGRLALNAAHDIFMLERKGEIFVNRLTVVRTEDEQENAE